MVRGCALGLLPAILVTLCSAEVRAQAASPAPSAHVQAPAPQAPSVSQASSSTQPSPSPPGPVPHTISVTFDYDFDRTPACTAKIQHRCVKQFVVYDISSGYSHPYQIGTVALPDAPYGLRRGILGKTDPHVFESGKHLIAVTAQGPEPQAHPFESGTAGCTGCTTWVNIP